MLSFRSLLAVLVAAGVHLSLCASSAAAWSIATVMDASLSSQSMSPALEHVFSCTAVTPAFGDEAPSPKESGGCGAKGGCLSQKLHTVSAGVLATELPAVVPTVPTAVQLVDAAVDFLCVQQRARDGPLYADAHLLAHVLQKRE